MLHVRPVDISMSNSKIEKILRLKFASLAPKIEPPFFFLNSCLLAFNCGLLQEITQQ